MLGILVLYWGFQIGSYWLELTTFARFMSRLVAGSLVILVFLVWWWTNRRIRFGDRLFGFATLVVTGAIAAVFCHSSVGGFALLLGPLPALLSVWIVWMLLSRRMSPLVQRVGLVVAVSLVWTYFTLIHIDGLTGDLRPSVRWRWSSTPEQAYSAQREQWKGKQENLAIPNGIVRAARGDWPGFRGPNRDSAVHGFRMRTDWKVKPPVLAWRHLVGPGWSSMVVIGDRLFTQEQHGDMEAVVCYNALTGKELWSHEYAGRFWEATAGVGPRASPCFAHGRIYALGCTGMLNCLDAASGKWLWGHDVRDDSSAAIPPWGFTSSPVVVENLLIVFAGGSGAKNLLAYDVQSGEPKWTAPAGETSYGSPQPVKIAGKEQVLLFSNRGLTAVDTAKGAVLWEYLAELPPAAPRSIQPQLLGKDRVLIASEGDLGLALLDVKKDGDNWTATRCWASRELKPAFNDFVVHEGHAYGFDGRIFGCVELETGARCWKEGRYGQGQVLLLADQSLLLVLSETGEVILVKADPKKSEVLGRFHAIQGKTWNHPVIAHGRLYVRNAEEMACYQLE